MEQLRPNNYKSSGDTPLPQTRDADISNRIFKIEGAENLQFDHRKLGGRRSSVTASSPKSNITFTGTCELNEWGTSAWPPRG
ncbi:hypothetical protein P3T76_015927 [Phytophthora citrophthora]|uniref:Uncharacterized protein n=1 Tax=Phytophthora citrophthora TaxID=4793 RepID=A0AAD9FYG7_9STRA|nr:hypothetical protein P3T76_015927 [Phytophthora citrophthora]